MYSHGKSLERLCSRNGLVQIDEYPEKIKLIIKEPIYMKNNWKGGIICPDIFLGYINKDWTVVEYKSSRAKKDYAAYQIESGKKLLLDYFDIPLKKIKGKFVYGRNKFKYEII